jgi:hypothetical protein
VVRTAFGLPDAPAEEIGAIVESLRKELLLV